MLNDVSCPPSQGAFSVFETSGIKETFERLTETATIREVLHVNQNMLRTLSRLRIMQESSEIHAC